MNKQLRPKLFLLASVAAAFTTVAWSVPACADAIVFSNLGDGNTYNQFSAVAFSGGGVGAPFTPRADFTLTQIDVALTHIRGFPSSARLSLEGASPTTGLPDGIPLESFLLTDLPVADTVDSIQPSQIVKPTRPVELVAGTEYWLVANLTIPGDFVAWHANITGATGDALLSSSGTWSFRPNAAARAFAVFGVPEPATLGLLALGLLGAGLSGRKRRS